MGREKYIFSKLLKKKEINLAGRDDISLYEIIEFITKYSEIGIIEYKKGILQLTAKGIKYIIKNRKKIYLTKTEKCWEVVPPEFLDRQVDKNKQIAIKLKGV